MVRPGEIGTVEFIKRTAQARGCEVRTVSLDGQFRCGGSVLYDDWVVRLLGITGGPVSWSELAGPAEDEYVVGWAPTPHALEKWLLDRMRGTEEVGRIAAGFCWEWSDPERGLDGAAGMDALRRSANKRGTPVLEAGTADFDHVVRVDDETDDDPVQLQFEGSADGTRWAAYRREQQQLRRTKFGDEAEITCDLCGRTLPSRFVRAAHIKRRADCEYPEHVQLENIMAACALGCDEVFEHGYIYVDEDGRIRSGPRCGEHEVLATFVSINLEGKRCAAYGTGSRPFFEYHRDRVTG